MTIATLIDKLDNLEVVRDEIAAILAVETAAQQVLATAAAKDPDLWRLRVFLERSNPWSEFIDAPDQSAAPPIVNVSVENANYDARASNIVERQKTTAIFNVDCYGYGISEGDGDGHIPGDKRAALEAHRAVRLVRNILMAGEYTYLGLRGTVWRRWIQSIQMFQPSIEGNALPQIVAARIAFSVEFNEFSPQVVAETLELVSATVRRAETGEIYFQTHYESTPDP